MFLLASSGLRGISDLNYAGMQWLDWSILAAVILILVGVLIYCNRFIRNAADFLAASRCAGRYILSISEGVAGFAVVNSVGSWEAFTVNGFSGGHWWGMLSAPLGLILSLTAWVTYRMRETRCFTLAQFYEVRYSRKLRVGSGILTWISGIVNYGIFPAVSIRFFMFFCRLPEKAEFLGVNWDIYGVLLTVAIGLGVIFAAFGGQIAIMVTDFLQGVFCNLAFVVFIFFIFKLGDWDASGGYVSWTEIAASFNLEPGYSQVNPFENTANSDFNYWYYLIGIFSAFYSRGSWQGSSGYSAAAKNPHERKMSGVLSMWRGMAQLLMIMLFPLAVIVITRHPDFAAINEVIQNQLASTTDATLKNQGLVPTALSMIMPTGLLGLFVAVMFAAMLSTDDTYMHSWGSIFIQDVIMPFRKKPFTPKQHILALRLSIIFVGVFAWLFSYFYPQRMPVFIFFSLTGAIVAGSGAAIIGGLYWKRGGTVAAWVSYIFGAVTSTAGFIIPLCWKDKIAPYLAETYHWQWVLDHMDRFPITGQWILFINMLGCSLLYVVISLIEHHVFKVPDFNLDKMLHRGKYDVNNEHANNGEVRGLAKLFGITPEFTLGDKLIYAASILWTIVWFVVFIVYTAKYFLFGGVSDAQWIALWHVKVYVILVIGVVCTAWFFIGGIWDVVKLFRDLKSSVSNDADDGTVVNGGNAGENVIEDQKQSKA